MFRSHAILGFAEPQNIKIETKNKPVPSLTLNSTPMIGVSDTIISDPNTGIALYGYDVIAYFIDGQAKLGQKQLETQFAGLTWQFNNEGNRAAFIANPESYLPQFGGYDPVFLQKDQIVASDPKFFQILDAKLYLFRNAENKQKFIDDEALRINSHQKWADMKRSLVKPH
jgi:YHS domain-containing protein